MDSRLTNLYEKYPGAVIRTEAKVEENWLLFTAHIWSSLDGPEIVAATRAYPASHKEAVSGEAVMDDALMMLHSGSCSMPNLVIGEAREDTSGDGKTEEAMDQDDAAQLTADCEGKTVKCSEEKASQEMDSAVSAATEPSDKGPVPPAEKPPALEKKLKLEEAQEAAKQVVFHVEEQAPLSIRPFHGKKMGEVMEERPSIIKFLTQPGGKKLGLAEEIYQAAEILVKCGG